MAKKIFTILVVLMVTTLTLSLAASGMSLGFSHDVEHPYLRLDGPYGFAAVKIGYLDTVRAGVKIPINGYYPLTSVNFKRPDTSSGFEMDSLNLGIGYATSTKIRIRIEAFLTNVNWNEWHDWRFNGELSLQYAFGNPFEALNGE